MEEPDYSLEYHHSHPHVGIEEHVRNRTIALGYWVNDRQRIYLDKRFWIILRDVELGRRTDKDSCKLLDVLREKVHSGRGICPISESLFIELYKQQDESTRIETASLMDELSKGVTLISYSERVCAEFEHLFHVFGKKRELLSIDILVWSKLSYVFGVLHPTSTLFEPREELVIQKTFFDHMWNTSLMEMIQKNGDSIPLMNDEALAAKLNEANQLHSSEIRNFKQAWKAEMTGAMSVFMPEARRILEEMYLKATGQSVDTTEQQRIEHEKRLLSYFHNAIEKTEVIAELRTLQITALCHAAYRWDKKRKLKKNDFLDFYHAAAAIGYCNLFLTEKPLRSMLQQKHLGIADNYQCIIVSSILEAIDCLSSSP